MNQWGSRMTRDGSKMWWFVTNTIQRMTKHGPLCVGGGWWVGGLAGWWGWGYVHINNTIQYNTIQYNTTQSNIANSIHNTAHNEMQYSKQYTIQCNTIGGSWIKWINSHPSYSVTLVNHEFMKTITQHGLELQMFFIRRIQVSDQSFLSKPCTPDTLGCITNPSRLIGGYRQN